MSKSDPLPKDVPGTEPPIREFVVRDPDPKRVKEAEPKGMSLRWLWWLLALIVLGLLAWWLFRACDRDDAACTTLPANVWTTAAQDSVWATMTGYDEQLTDSAMRPNVLTGLHALCNQRLGGATLNANSVFDAFPDFVFGESTVNNILGLVNDHNGFCRCN